MLKLVKKFDVKILSISSTERHLGLSLKGAKQGVVKEEKEVVVEEKPEVTQEELADAVETALEEELGEKK